MLTVTINQDGAITTVNVAALDETALDNDLLDKTQWITDAIAGKINNTRKRMVKQGIDALRADGLSVPSDDDSVITAYAALPTYKDRRGRGD